MQCVFCCFLLMMINDLHLLMMVVIKSASTSVKNLHVAVYLGFKSQCLWLTYFFHSLNQWAFMSCWRRNYCSWIGVAINFLNRVKLTSQKNFIFNLQLFSAETNLCISLNFINHFFLVPIKVSLCTRWELSPVHRRQHNRATANGLSAYLS